MKNIVLLCFKARVNAEEHAATLQRQRIIEEKKMKELEKIREQLENLLVKTSS